MDGDAGTIGTLPADNESGMPMDGSGEIPLDTPPDTTGAADAGNAPILLNDAPLDLSGATDQYTTPPPPSANSPFALDPNADPVPPADIPNAGSNVSSW